jgi:hypothetical protein
MIPAIELENISAVLLADGWHDVRDSSFEIGDYNFIHDKEVRFAGGSLPGISSKGARWTETADKHIYCPLNSILAVRCG